MSAEAFVVGFQPKSQEVKLRVVVETICKENVHITESVTIRRRLVSASRGTLTRTGD